MKLKNKTRYAILGMLLDEPLSGYEIKSFMARSTVYFWRESDSTIYPMLKVLAKEGKVRSKTFFVGKKRKEVFSITDEGKAELDAWIASPTGSEIPRNEFLLKLFFITDHEAMVRLFQERLERTKNTYEEYKEIEKRLEGLIDSPRKEMRLKALRYGIAQLTIEIQWLNEEVLEYAHY
ncbi:MAG: PadR family transcriptional regulator [Chlamydiales bacterium]|nr:PadR family transcriptional regulator [Chlamydiales bacterium]